MGLVFMRIFLIALFLVAFGFVACDDSSTSSTEQNADTEQVSSSSVNLTVEQESSSSVVPNDTKQSSSSEKDVEVKSSSSINSAVEPESSAEGENNSSSSSLVNLDGWIWDKETYLNPEINYGTMMDERDGKIYKTVKIGDQTWMAENLNYSDSVKTPSLKGKSWCYKNDEKYCDVAGRLYTWAAAIDSVKFANDDDNPRDCGNGEKCIFSDTVHGICPPGWHLPDTTEWVALFMAVGGQSTDHPGESTAGYIIKTQRGWNDYKGISGNGSDAFGFSALPAGHGDVGSNKVYFYDYGCYTDFWGAYDYGGSLAYRIALSFAAPDIAYLGHGTKRLAFSVRCVKD
ncbi:major paralogous domain-containing protein [Fibrobacter sp. UWOV1]|nr:major paralogous domain-containing protein [Fibrobacter sp. UWOV1]